MGQTLKVAVCLSGHMRTFKNTHEKLKEHLLNRYECDVFVHTWTSLGSSRPEDAAAQMTEAELYDEVKNVYRPVMHLFEQQKTFSPENRKCFKFARSKPENVMSKWYSTKESLFLAQAHVLGKYDAYVSLRSDMLFDADVTIEKPEPGVLYVPGNIRVPEFGIHDYFAYGDADVMKHYVGVFDSFDRTTETLIHFRPEIMLSHYLATEKIPLRFVDISYSLVRLNGEVRKC